MNQNLVSKYSEEVRCDFLVTTRRKKLWMVQLAMLNKFKLICAKHHLKYFAIGGTLLGAVRHSGYIPWDDDIDVGMPRADFEKFLKVVDAELDDDKNLIAQYTTFDKNYSTPHARITNINTTAYFPFIKNAGVDVPQGIFIDIFPFDNIPNAKWKKNIHRFVYRTIAYMLHEKQNHYRLEHASILSKILRNCSRLLFLFTNVEKVFSWTQNWIQKYNTDLTCLSFSSISTFYHIERLLVRKEWFDEIVELPFEDTNIACPKRYEEVLTYNFGDWKKMVKSGSFHEGCFYDPDKPYTFYKDKDLKNYSNEL